MQSGREAGHACTLTQVLHGDSAQEPRRLRGQLGQLQGSEQLPIETQADSG